MLVTRWISEVPCLGNMRGTEPRWKLNQGGGVVVSFGGAVRQVPDRESV